MMTMQQILMLLKLGETFVFKLVLVYTSNGLSEKKL